MKRSLQIQLPRRKPRNPVSVPARQRHAGAHGPDGGALRQRAQRALRHEITHGLDSP